MRLRSCFTVGAVTWVEYLYKPWEHETEPRAKNHDIVLTYHVFRAIQTCTLLLP